MTVVGDLSVSAFVFSKNYRDVNKKAVAMYDTATAYMFGFFDSNIRTRREHRVMRGYARSFGWRYQSRYQSSYTNQSQRLLR